MITIRKSEERGHADRGWINSYFTFTFGGYRDTEHMGFRALRVLNDDRIAPGMGFGAHAHRDMEIITYVLEGQLQHKDSMGEHHTFGANTIQAMSAGTGVVHSEFNPSDSEPVHLIQIWIDPAEEDVEPSYQQIPFDPAEKRGRWRLIASPQPGNGVSAATIHQDAQVYAAVLAPGEILKYQLAPQRHAWVQVASGTLNVGNRILATGDGAAISAESELVFTGAGAADSEFLLFDLA